MESFGRRVLGFEEYEPSYLLSLLPERAQRALDVGCGTGILGQRLQRELACTVSGIEKDPTAAEIASDFLDEVVDGDVETCDLPWPAGSFDLVVCSNLMGDLLDPAATVERLVPLIAPGGCLIASTNLVTWIRTVFAMSNERLEGVRRHNAFPPGILHYYSESTFVTLLEDAGLSVDDRAARQSDELRFDPAQVDHVAVALDDGAMLIMTDEGQVAMRLTSDIAVRAVRPAVAPDVLGDPVADGQSTYDPQAFVVGAVADHFLTAAALVPTRRQFEQYMDLLREPHAHFETTVSEPGLPISLESSAYLLWYCDTFNPLRAMDLGSGFSSFVLRMYQARAAQRDESVDVVSIDHSPEWLARTGDFIGDRGFAPVGLMLYSDFDAAAAGRFDLILSDIGETMQLRIGTSEMAIGMLSDDGVVIVDDINKPVLRHGVDAAVERAGARAFSLRRCTLDDWGCYQYLILPSSHRCLRDRQQTDT